MFYIAPWQSAVIFSTLVVLGIPFYKRLIKRIANEKP
jgi:hypothetical protein